MDTYNLRIVHKYRMIFTVAITATLLLLLYLGLTSIRSMLVQNFVFILFLGPCVYLVYRYCSGRLEVKLSETEMSFKWDVQPFLDYRYLIPIRYKEILSVEIDDDNRINKITTAKISVKINTFGKRNDEVQFLEKIKNLASNNDFVIVDFWDELRVNGNMRWLYSINLGGIVLILCALTYAIFTRQFESSHLLVVLFLSPQLVGFHFIMRRKLKNASLANKDLELTQNQ